MSFEAWFGQAEDDLEASNSVQDQCRYPAARGTTVVAPYKHVAFGDAQTKDFVEKASMLLQWCQERAQRAQLAVVAMKPAPSSPNA